MDRCQAGCWLGLSIKKPKGSHKNEAKSGELADKRERARHYLKAGLRDP